MKKLILSLCTAGLALSLCACGNADNTSSAPSSAAETAAPVTEQASVAGGNQSAFSMTKDALVAALEGTWVNQSDLTEKLRFDADLGVTRFSGSERKTGTATLDENSGMLTLRYDGEDDEKTYIWVDSLDNLNANTWYVDGGTFAIGGSTYIRDLEI